MPGQETEGEGLAIKQTKEAPEGEGSAYQEESQKERICLSAQSPTIPDTVLDKEGGPA